MPKINYPSINNADQIDRNSYEPAYLQLANILRQKIADGQFRPGQQLPSEAKLRSGYNVSQMTARRSVGLLQEQGLVNTAQGKGSFVIPLKLGMFSFQLSALQKLFTDKDRTTIKLLEVDLVYPDEKTAAILSTLPDARVIYIKRLIFQGGTPAVLHYENLVYDPSRPLVESEMEVTSLEGLFSKNGETDFKKGELTIGAAALDTQEALLLAVSNHSPVLSLEHVFYDFKDVAVSRGQFLCRKDMLSFSARVGLW